MGRDNLDNAKNTWVLANLLARRQNASFPMIGKYFQEAAKDAECAKKAEREGGGGERDVIDGAVFCVPMKGWRGIISAPLPVCQIAIPKVARCQIMPVMSQR